MNAKIRWEGLSRDFNDPEETDPDIETEIALLEAKSRRVFDDSTLTFSNMRRRVTDLPGNTRVKLPIALPPNIFRSTVTTTKKEIHRSF